VFEEKRMVTLTELCALLAVIIAFATLVVKVIEAVRK
jgi:hypothetical protein